MTWMSQHLANGMMNTNLIIPLNLTQHFVDAFERYLDEHITKVGDFNCLIVESVPDDTMYLCNGSELVKVINIGTGV
jgi:hypothetical protein